MMRRFHLIHCDPGGGLAAELIGEGVQFGDGTAAVLWSGVSVEITHQHPDAIAHGENLEAVWLDDPQPAAGATVRPLRLLGAPRG